jgi:hypothetical protein
MINRLKENIWLTKHAMESTERTRWRFEGLAGFFFFFFFFGGGLFRWRELVFGVKSMFVLSSKRLGRCACIVSKE